MAKPDIKRITFKNHLGEGLTGDLYLPEPSTGLGVVFGHCFTCSRHTRILIESCQALYNEGIVSLRFDFSGNGQSEGDFAQTTYSKHVAEMILAMDQLTQVGVERVGLAGHSMGAAVSLLTAARSPAVKAVCTLAGRYSRLTITGLLTGSNEAALNETGQVNFTSRGRQLSLSGDFFSDASSHDLPGSVSTLVQPLLAIHGDRDEIIPVSEVYQSQTLKPENTEIAVINGADHMFSLEEHRLRVASLVATWFNEQLNRI